jgi:hypothetical protein
MNRRKLLSEITWTGPYSWPKFEAKNNLPPLPKHPGVYLMTVKYKDGYLIYAAGITRRPIPIRFSEHTKKYLAGDYNVLDIVAIQNGIRKEIWHGWGWTPEKRENFEEKKSLILDAVEKQLEGFCLFVADIPTSPRILERVEASIMNILYHCPPPFCDIPDRGMMLAPRKADETPIMVKQNCELVLHGLPLNLEI